MLNYPGFLETLAHFAPVFSAFAAGCSAFVTYSVWRHQRVDREHSLIVGLDISGSLEILSASDRNICLIRLGIRNISKKNIVFHGFRVRNLTASDASFTKEFPVDPVEIERFEEELSGLLTLRGFFISGSERFEMSHYIALHTDAAFMDITLDTFYDEDGRTFNQKPPYNSSTDRGPERAPDRPWYGTSRLVCGRRPQNH